MKSKTIGVAVAAICAAAVAGCGSGGGGKGPVGPAGPSATAAPRHEGAEDVAPGAKRKILHKKTLDEFPGNEAVMSWVEYAPGAMSGEHFHSGPELVYVLTGTVTIEPKGGEPRTLKAGETYYNKTKAVHNVSNKSTTETATFIAFLVNEEGQLLATPVKKE